LGGLLLRRGKGEGREERGGEERGREEREGEGKGHEPPHYLEEVYAYACNGTNQQDMHIGNCMAVTSVR